MIAGVSVSSIAQRRVGGLGREHAVAARLEVHAACSSRKSRSSSTNRTVVWRGHGVAPLSSIIRPDRRRGCGSSTWKVVPLSVSVSNQMRAAVHLDDAVADRQAEAGALADASWW